MTILPGSPPILPATHTHHSSAFSIHGSKPFQIFLAINHYNSLLLQFSALTHFHREFINLKHLITGWPPLAGRLPLFIIVTSSWPSLAGDLWPLAKCYDINLSSIDYLLASANVSAGLGRAQKGPVLVDTFSLIQVAWLVPTVQLRCEMTILPLLSDADRFLTKFQGHLNNSDDLQTITVPKITPTRPLNLF